MCKLRLIVIFLLGLLIISGCGRKKEQQIMDLQAKNAKLTADFSQKDSLLNDLFTSINDIERNLSDITSREKLITAAPVEEKKMDQDVRNKIMDEIIAINNVMEENKKQLAQLRSQLKKSDTKIAALQETINMLTKKLEEKEIEVNSLKDELVKLNFTVESLNIKVDTLRKETASKSKIISQQDSLIGEMNTIWYVVGTRKDLIDKGVIEKAGGVLSGNMKMSEMINPDYFTTADMRKLTQITFECKKAELITVHPEGTYKFLGGGEKITGLEITNASEFWKSSRFLVIMTR